MIEMIFANPEAFLDSAFFGYTGRHLHQQEERNIVDVDYVDISDEVNSKETNLIEEAHGQAEYTVAKI